jgi:hypothetical protein
MLLGRRPTLLAQSLPSPDAPRGHKVMAAATNGETQMRAMILSIFLEVLVLLLAGCSADIHAGGRNGGVNAGAAVGGNQPVYVEPAAPIPR